MLTCCGGLRSSLLIAILIFWTDGSLSSSGGALETNISSINLIMALSPFLAISTALAAISTMSSATLSRTACSTDCRRTVIAFLDPRGLPAGFPDCPFLNRCDPGLVLTSVEGCVILGCSEEVSLELVESWVIGVNIELLEETGKQVHSLTKSHLVHSLVSLCGILGITP